MTLAEAENLISKLTLDEMYLLNAFVTSLEQERITPVERIQESAESV